ncbi:MAG: 8-oxo-dGTP pyrophosphatase MutT (NUDIX family) [Paracoccaceae bacterium]|jgi:8-oxo-dGTP pyrophosphatase MutT (NUDIX family)
MDKSALRNAATLIVHRSGPEGPEVLMGQRGAAAAFMPNKFVFPGGAIDPSDSAITLAGLPHPDCLSRLEQQSQTGLAHACLAAAIRELWEETGLLLGVPGAWQGTPAPDWSAFAEAGHLPCAAQLAFVFRAVTPHGRPRRFDARFFLTHAQAIVGDSDDFSKASDELSHLQWIPLAKVRAFDLPFITEVVLAEITPLITNNTPPQSVPFVQHDNILSGITRLV